MALTSLQRRVTLHALDLATNKLLAVVGRREARDWVDVVQCHEKVQRPLGNVAWAAAGKDPGFSPLGIVEECARTRYVQSEIDGLDFEGPAPNVTEISSRWHGGVRDAREIVSALPAEEVGRLRLDASGYASVAAHASRRTPGRSAMPRFGTKGSTQWPSTSFSKVGGLGPPHVARYLGSEVRFV